MKTKTLVPIIIGFAAAIILFGFFSQESISKNLGLEKEHYELSFGGIETFQEGDPVNIKMLLSGYGTDCATFFMEIRNADGEAVERTGSIVDCTQPPMKKMNSVEVFTITSKLGAGNYSVFAQFSPNPDKYFTKTENFTVTKNELEKNFQDYAKGHPNVIMVTPKKEPSSSWSHSYWNNNYPGARIIGLQNQYLKDEPIVFDVKIYGDGSGCGQGTILILEEYEMPPPLFSQEYVGNCKYIAQNHNLVMPMHFEINTPDGQIPSLEPGKYVAHATYYQHRGSYGDLKQEFVITDEAMQNDSTKTKNTVNDNFP